jgi:hypothetical protein
MDESIVIALIKRRAAQVESHISALLQLPCIRRIKRVWRRQVRLRQFPYIIKRRGSGVALVAFEGAAM